MRRVEWSQDARNDLLGISLYISQDSPAAAVRVVRAIQRAANAIALAPTVRRARTKGLLERSVPGTRYVLAFVHYKDEIGGDVFVIQRIVHTSRDWPRGKPPPK